MAHQCSPASVLNAAGTVAYGLMKYYTGNNTGDNPGNLPDPYYCQEALLFFTISRLLFKQWILTLNNRVGGRCDVWNHD